MASALIIFTVGSIVIVLAGMRLSAYGDEVAERTGWGGALVGIVLLATVTSFPELVIGVTSSATSSPDFAVGNALGSNLYNLTIIAVADGFYRSGTLLGSVSANLLLSSAIGQILVALVTLAIFLKVPLQIGWIGVDSIGLILAYALCLGMIGQVQARERAAVQALEHGASVEAATQYAAVPEHAPATVEEAVEEAVETEIVSDGAEDARAQEREEMAEKLDARPLQSLSSRGLYGRIGLCALLILVAGPPMVGAAETIAGATGLSMSFVGSVFLAIVGSLPELVVSISAVRIGAYDMAVGNVLGSNMFNVVLLALSDFFYTKGPLLQAASSDHVVVGLFVILLTAVVMTGVLYRSQRTTAGFGTDSILVLGGYAAALVILFQRSTVQ